MKPSARIRLALMFVVAGGVSGLGAPIGISTLPTARADASFIGDKPFTGDRRLVEINFHLATYFGYGYVGFANPGYGGVAFGPGFDMVIPVIKNGFIPSLNNAFYIGFFVDPLFHITGGYNYLSLSLGAFAQWRFFLLKMFDDGGLSAFANLGFGVWPWFWDSFGHCPGCGVGVTGFPLFQVGANLNFTKNIALRVAFGYPSANFGVNIAF